MRALVFDGSLGFERDYPQPKPSEGEALIRVGLAGICRTDIELTRGYMGFRGIPGHEFVGQVVDAGVGHIVGKRVVGEINCSCGVCELCRGGLDRHCPNRTVLGILGRDGVFADFTVLPEGNLHVVPDAIADEEAVFTEPLAAALEILEQVHIAPDWRIAVLGDGKLGLLIAQVLLASGAEVAIWGHHRAKMGFLEELGARAFLAQEAVNDRAHNFDVVVEATGSWDGLELARILLRPRGTLVLKSTLAAGKDLNLSWLVIEEITVVGSRCGPFLPALRLLSQGAIRTRELIDGKYPIDRWQEAFGRATSPGTKKILLDMR